MNDESTKRRVAKGPPGVPLLGNAPAAWKSPLGLFVDSWREYGDVVRFRMGPFDYFLVNDPDGIHHVLVDNHKNYTKSRNYQGLRLVLGQGLVTSEGEFWRRQRKLAQPAFHRERLAGFVDQMAGDTASMLERWSGAPPPPFDMHHEMMRLTFRIVGRTLFTTDVDGDSQEIGRAIAVALHFANSHAESLVNFPQWMPTPANLRFQRALAKLDELVFRIIDDRRKGRGAAVDLLAMLMSAKDEETREQMTDRQLRDEVMTIILAGHETTAAALTWTFYLLSKHPEFERRLAAEVSEVLGDRAPRLEDLPRLKLTAMIVQEAMRLYPPVWAFERQAVAGDVVAGVEIPARAIVAICPYTVQRHPAHWENPEGFDPERFLPGRSEGRHRYAYLPFGGGPRQCIGNGFAMMEAQVIVAMIVQRYRLDLVAGHRVEPEPVVTLRPKRGVMMSRRPQRSRPPLVRAVIEPEARAL